MKTFTLHDLIQELKGIAEREPEKLLMQVYVYDQQHADRYPILIVDDNLPDCIDINIQTS